MRSDLKDENEIKIFILYLMNQFSHGLCYGDMENMTYESGYVGYFDFAEIFAKLIDSGDIEKIKENGKDIYNITQRGKAIAENLEHLIPAAPKTKGIAIASRYSDWKKSGALISHSLKEEGDGYRFECSIADKQKNSENFHISLFVKDKITAEKIAAAFKENPGAVYRGVYAMLTGNADFLF